MERTGEDKPKIIRRKVKIHGNPMKRYQVTSVLNVNLRAEDAKETPPTLPDGTPLLTQSEKMAKDFENAGNPTKGSQPPSDFEPEG